MEHLQDKLENEKDNQLTKLKDEIAKRRKRKQEKKRKELEASAAKEESERQQADEQEQQELMKMNEQQADELRRHAEDATRPITPGFPLRMSENVPDGEQPTTILHPPPPEIPDDLSEVTPPKMVKPHPKPAAYNVEMGEQDLSNLLMSLAKRTSATGLFLHCSTSLCLELCLFAKCSMYNTCISCTYLCTPLCSHVLFADYARCGFAIA